MKRFFIWVCVTLYLALPFAALAQPDPVATMVPAVTPIPEGDLEGAVDLLPKLLDAVQQKNWGLVAAIGLSLLVFVFRTYLWKKITKEWLPIASVLTAGASATSLALYADQPPLAATLAGLLVGLGAVGAYEFYKAVKRLVTGNKKPAPDNG